MKKILLAIALLTQIHVQAQSDRAGITFKDQSVTKQGDTVIVTFRCEVGKTARAGRTVVLAPALSSVNYRWSLTPVIIQGRRARFAEARHDWKKGASGIQAISETDAVFTQNKRTITYQARTPWQLWMDGADLIVEGIDMGCCSHNELTPMLLAENLNLPAPKTEPVIVEVTELIEIPVPVVQPVTTGDKLAQSYFFVLPASQLETINPGELFDDDRDNALQIFFRQGKSIVDQGVMPNSQSLTDLMAAIRVIENSVDSRIKNIVIAGFASPEGSFELNDKLAWDRAVSVKKYIMDHSGLQGEMIAIYNGSEDWRGLKMLVEQSNMESRSEVIRIIDTVPIWDSAHKTGRLGELMKLDGGMPYKYMYEHFFPKLRNAAYIKLYYENK